MKPECSMPISLFGTKEGMTQVFDTKDGRVLPVTVIKIETNVVVGHRTQARNGYSAVQVGTRVKRPTLFNRPDAGQFAAASKLAGKEIAPRAVVREVRLAGDPGSDLAVGAEIGVEVMDGVAFVDVIGTSKGKGFQGVVKIHHFKGFSRSHGTHEYFRHSGSIGTRLTPGHVLGGKRMARQMGSERVTTQNLRLHGADRERGLLFVVGAVPGPTGGLVEVRSAVKKEAQKRNGKKRS
jgi:large subunit ribosomal protein L3